MISDEILSHGETESAHSLDVLLPDMKVSFGPVLILDVLTEDIHSKSLHGTQDGWQMVQIAQSQHCPEQSVNSVHRNRASALHLK